MQKLTSYLTFILLTLVLFLLIRKHYIRLSEHDKDSDISLLTEAGDYLDGNYSVYDKLYFKANDPRLKLFIQTQMAFAPTVLLNYNDKDVPVDSMCLFVLDRTSEKNNNSLEDLKDSTTVMDSVELYKFSVYLTKQVK